MRNERGTRHQRVISETLIQSGVGNRQNLFFVYSVTAERDVPRGLPGVETHSGLEPLAL